MILFTINTCVNNKKGREEITCYVKKFSKVKNKEGNVSIMLLIIEFQNWHIVKTAK